MGLNPFVSPLSRRKAGNTYNKCYHLILFGLNPSAQPLFNSVGYKVDDSIDFRFAFKYANNQYDVEEGLHKTRVRSFHVTSDHLRGNPNSWVRALGAAIERGLSQEALQIMTDQIGEKLEREYRDEK